MPKFQVQRSAYVWYSVEVEAENEEEARDLGEELLGDGKHTDEDFGDWTSDETYIDEIPDRSAPKEEPDVVY
jgi:hypothetical protein